MVVVIPGRTPDCQQNDPFGIWAETSPARQRLVGRQGEPQGSGGRGSAYDSTRRERNNCTANGLQIEPMCYCYP